MRHLYITEGIDEQKMLDSAREQSRHELVRVHWHSARTGCTLANDHLHRAFADGEEVEVVTETIVKPKRPA